MSPSLNDLPPRVPAHRSTAKDNNSNKAKLIGSPSSIPRSASSSGRSSGSRSPMINKATFHKKVSSTTAKPSNATKPVKAEDDCEDLLKSCINMGKVSILGDFAPKAATPPIVKRPSTNKPTPSFSPQPTVSQAVAAFEPAGVLVRQRSARMSGTTSGATSRSGYDQKRQFNLEDTPINFSTVASSLSSLSMPSDGDEEPPAPPPRPAPYEHTFGEGENQGKEVVVVPEDDDVNDLLKAAINTGMSTLVQKPDTATRSKTKSKFPITTLTNTSNVLLQQLQRRLVGGGEVSGEHENDEHKQNNKHANNRKPTAKSSKTSPQQQITTLGRSSLRAHRQQQQTTVVVVGKDQTTNEPTEATTTQPPEEEDIYDCVNAEDLEHEVDEDEKTYTIRTTSKCLRFLRIPDPNVSLHLSQVLECPPPPARR